MPIYKNNSWEYKYGEMVRKQLDDMESNETINNTDEIVDINNNQMEYKYGEMVRKQIDYSTFPY